MAIAEAKLQQRVALLTGGLRRAGVKLTHQRVEISREIAASNTHPDAETVYTGVRERVPTISLDTVYRTLHTLLDLGLIGTLGFPRVRMRFDCNTAAHHHFVCTQCGGVRDFYSEDFDRSLIPDDLSTFGMVQRIQVEARGICLKCSKGSDL